MTMNDLNAEQINGYKNTALTILHTQIGIIERAKPILPNNAELKPEQQNKVLSIEKADELKEILNNEIEKLQKFDVVLAVVGTMKAGKSTTINAIVGREILPNRNRPMTALPTLICHNPSKHTPSLTIKPDVLNKLLMQLKPQLHLAPHHKTSFKSIIKD